jgi:hypothetical protein
MTHQALLELAEKKNFFYIYETIKDLYMIDDRYHRSLYKNILKKSRYFIANKAKIDGVDETGGQEEVGARFFEGAAAGSVMVGVPPVCEAFHQNFDWEDAAIKIPFDAANIAQTLEELDAQPERLQKIRRENVVNSLLRHDWVYRWERILATVGLDSTPAMAARKANLQNLAAIISSPRNGERQIKHFFKKSTYSGEYASAKRLNLKSKNLLSFLPKIMSYLTGWILTFCPQRKKILP